MLSKLILSLGLTINYVLGAEFVYVHREGHTDGLLPGQWHETYPECGGNIQSPINIANWITDSDVCDSGLDWTLPETNRFNIENNGHSIKITPIYSDSDSDGEGAILKNPDKRIQNVNQEYCFDSFHLHFNGSEHTLNGQRYVAEGHFVHYSCDYNDITAAITAATSNSIQDKYTLSVVGVMYALGDENSGFSGILTDQVLNELKYHSENGKSAEINLNIESLLPSNLNAYMYEGSLTTPGCQPIVRWNVLSNVKTISEAQLSMLESFMAEEGDNNPIAPNYRPIQSNPNQIYYCQED